MSEENVEIVRRCYDGTNRYYAAKTRGDDREAQRVVDELSALVVSEFEYLEDPKWPGARTYRGIDEFLAIFEEYREQFSDQAIVVENLIADRDKVVALVTWRATGTSSGAEAEMHQGHVITLREGRLTRLQIFFDRQEALEAAGLQD